MAEFPTLKSGAVAQYPLARTLNSPTRVLRFIDGREQRFRRRGRAQRQWTIQLDFLAEDELQAVAEFFAAQRGQDGNFRFVDPSDGQAYPNCSFVHDEIDLEQVTEGYAKTTVVVKENLD